jgi:hypothetical protein
MPFHFCDVHLLVNNRHLDHTICPIHELLQAMHVALEFTTQKNGVRGELVSLGKSGHPSFCPVQAIVNRIRHLREFLTPPTTPIFSYFQDDMWKAITTSTLTQYLRAAATAVGLTSGIQAADISVRSLRSSGAMALLCARVDSDCIRLLGRWRSDEMLPYLHVQAFPITATFASQMLHHGNFALIPNNHLPGA